MQLFCYGTLQFPEIMQAVCGHDGAAQPASLRGYACNRIRDEVFPGIIRCDGACTRGVLYSGVGRRHLRLLDRFESGFYVRRRVPVVSGSRLVPAWAYVVSPAHRNRVSSECWDCRAFAQRHLRDFSRRCGVR